VNLNPYRPQYVGKWLYQSLLVISVLMQGMIYSKVYLSTTTFHKTRLGYLASAFSWINIAIGALHLFIAVCTSCLYMNMGGHLLFRSCTVGSENSVCLIEETFFLMLGQAFVAVFYFVDRHVIDSPIIQFPFVQQHKWIQLKVNLFPIMRASCRRAILPSFIYLIFYYLRGGSLAELFCFTLSIHRGDGKLDTVFGLLSLTLFLKLWFFGFLFIVSMSMTELMMKIFMTERYKFTVVEGVEEPTTMSLDVAVTVKEVPIVLHLAFLDLALLSESQMPRRQRVFTLSQPGGHPHHWNVLKRECFGIIEQLSEGFDSALRGPLTKPLNAHLKTPYPTKVSFGQWLLEGAVNKLSGLKKFPLVAYLIGEVCDMQVRQLLSSTLPAQWAVESLAFLAAHSISEDQYGVMQNDLPQIIISLLKLKHSLDRLSKHPTLFKKSPKRDLQSLRIRNTLRSTVKRSLYRIAITFSPFITDMQLPREVEKQMLAYVAFKE
jgi:nucleoporin NDC1